MCIFQLKKARWEVWPVTCSQGGQSRGPAQVGQVGVSLEGLSTAAPALYLR